jgi:lactoylglutathione lyase
MTTMTDVRTIGVRVSDQDAAISFFTDVLGFQKRMDARISDTMRWVEVAPPGATTSLSLVAAGDAGPRGGDTGIRFSATNAATEHERLAAEGVRVGELLVGDYAPPMFTFDDPDGNRFYLVEDAG